ncbi:MAG: OB-fold nucleic acid binding domain-containing protein [Candidatus Nomurabacteria bacterium]|nr:OB-fold nucleic acid binding domain-containing protein [Candidatus Nomurabacteria bacterium]
MRTLIKNLNTQKGETVTINGWVHVARDQGKMAFFDFRDMTGTVQGVVFGKPEVLEIAKTLRPEWVVAVTGIVNERPEKMVKAGVLNGDIELEITEITVLNTATTPAFELTESTIGINERVRLENRYVDLRTDRLQKNLRMRHAVAKLTRDILDDEGFTEIETPLFTKSTPEGARDYVVPARLYPGQFYALPQSPQQYKQLLMAGGIERYFQFAKCMRDEDTRGDRQPEFTQMDMEMSFATEDEIMAINEKVLIAIVEKLYPEKRIQTVPFPRITYAEAMEKHGSDRPDLREDKTDDNLLAFAWVVDWPFFEKTADSDDPQATGEWTFTHNPFSLSKPEHIENLKNKTNIGDIMASQYDITLNGLEIGGGSIRAHDPEILKSILQILGHSDEKIEKNFGHMLRALGSGTPPHGGIAWGFDRLMMILQNEPNIREVIAFPKTGEGRDLMMDSPSPISDQQLGELNIKLDLPVEE